MKKKFWEIVDKLDWSRWKDNKSLDIIKSCKIRLTKMGLSVEERKEFEDLLTKKFDLLKKKFRHDSIVYDDTGMDLRAEVVSRGKKFYKNITLKELKRMKKNHDYRECFLYIMNHNYYHPWNDQVKN